MMIERTAPPDVERGVANVFFTRKEAVCMNEITKRDNVVQKVRIALTIAGFVTAAAGYSAMTADPRDHLMKVSFFVLALIVAQICFAMAIYLGSRTLCFIGSCAVCGFILGCETGNDVFIIAASIVLAILALFDIRKCAVSWPFNTWCLIVSVVLSFTKSIRVLVLEIIFFAFFVWNVNKD